MTKKKKGEEKYLFGMTKQDFTHDKLIEGALIRPIIMMIAFFTFILAMFFLLIENQKWGGSLILFSFILNIYSIYESFCDEASIFKTLNLAFKFVLFLCEIVAFNWLLINVI